MKPLYFSITLCAVIAGGSAGANPAFSPQYIDHSPRIMLYVHKNVGATHRQQSAMAFGLSLERETNFSRGENMFGLRPENSFAALPQSVRVFDFRMSAFDRSGVSINGLSLDSEGSYGSYDTPSFKSIWFKIGGGTLLTLVGLCLAKIGICESDSNPSSSGGMGY